MTIRIANSGESEKVNLPKRSHAQIREKITRHPGRVIFVS